MNTNHFALFASSVAVLIAIGAWVAIPEPGFGGSTSATFTAANLVSNGDLTVADDATINGGVLTVTTAANSTSTAIVGAIETYATSSATKICIKPSTAGATSTFHGTLYFSYGECDSL